MASEKIDTGIEEELIAGIQELIQVENHCYKSWIGTKDDKYLKIYNKAREIRTKWAEKLFKEEEGSQKWCIQMKHVLSGSTRFQEAGSKFLSLGKEEDCKEAFLDSGEILGMYYFLNGNPEKVEKLGFLSKLLGGEKWNLDSKDMNNKDK